MDTYQVMSLDVWAGDEEGTYEKNNFFNVGQIQLADCASDEQILQAMIEEGFLNINATLETVEIQDHNCDGFYIEILDKTNNYPLYDLRKV